MAQTLRMTFVNEAGNKYSLNFKDPKAGITAAEISAAMDVIIAKNIFETTGGDLVSKDSAVLIDTTETPLAVI
ncbi:MAG: DUF2922 domain-containing protein [Caldisericales bacterium]|jgi:hypothetical protein|nr:DUF2922 domain-containing protein [Caldisericales bacterium]